MRSILSCCITSSRRKKSEKKAQQPGPWQYVAGTGRTGMIVAVAFVLLVSSDCHAAAMAVQQQPLLPPWPPTYDMQSSTILQPSNADGWLPLDLAKWGIVVRARPFPRYSILLRTFHPCLAVSRTSTGRIAGSTGREICRGRLARPERPVWRTWSGRWRCSRQRGRRLRPGSTATS